MTEALSPQGRKRFASAVPPSSAEQMPSTALPRIPAESRLDLLAPWRVQSGGLGANFPAGTTRGGLQSPTPTPCAPYAEPGAIRGTLSRIACVVSSTRFWRSSPAAVPAGGTPGTPIWTQWLRTGATRPPPTRSGPHLLPRFTGQKPTVDQGSSHRHRGWREYSTACTPRQATAPMPHPRATRRSLTGTAPGTRRGAGETHRAPGPDRPRRARRAACRPAPDRDRRA